MARKAVFTVCVDNYLPDVCELTLPRIREYAARIGADFHLIQDRKFPQFPPTYEKAQIYELGADYDFNILIDADLGVSRRLEDLTNEVAPDEIGAWMTFDASGLFESDETIWRKKRPLGVVSNLLVVPRACHGFWKPLEISLETAKRACRREFIIDEFCFSRNLALNDFKITRILPIETRVHHVSANSQPAPQALRALREFLEKDDKVQEKRALLTVCSGDFFEQMGEITHPTLKNYASRVGADFLVWKDCQGWDMPAYKKLEIAQLLDHYDRVLYVDTDVIIRPDTPDLFDLVPPEKFGIFEEGKYENRTPGFIEFLKSVKFDPNRWDGRFFNTGVMLASKSHRSVFTLPPIQTDHFYEQGYLNTTLAHFGPPIEELDYRFNRMSSLDWHTGESRHASYFIHYAGALLAMSQENVLLMIAKDLEVWRQTDPDYRFFRRIVVECDGDLSEAIYAEPVVRHLKEKIFHSDEVTVVSTYPEIFAHLGLKVLPRNQIPPNGNGVRFINIRRSKIAAHLPQEFIHPTDIASLNGAQYLLSPEEKSIRLSIRAGDEQEPLRALHPLLPQQLVAIDWGPESNFPVFARFLELLEKKSIPYCILGDSIPAQSEPSRLTNQARDLRGKLSLAGRIALLSRIPVLIAVESSSLAIAGAFETWIGLVPTRKRAEYTLPFRNGVQNHRTRVLGAAPKGLSGYDKLFSQKKWHFEAEKSELVPTSPNAEDVLRFIQEHLPAQRRTSQTLDKEVSHSL